MKLYEITELQKELEREEDAEIASTLQEMVKIELENKAQNIFSFSWLKMRNNSFINWNNFIKIQKH